MARVCRPTDVADALDCSVDLIYDEIKDGNLEALMVRGDYRIELTELDAYIERQKEIQRQRIALRNAPRRRGRRPASATATATA